MFYLQHDIQELMRVRVRFYKGSQNSRQVKNYISGHQKMLERIGITEVAASLNSYLDNTYLIYIEDAECQVIAGAKLVLYSEHSVLPIVEAISYMEEMIFPEEMYNVKRTQVAEICGLWISKDAVGLGLHKLLIECGIALAKTVNVDVLLALCAPYTVGTAENYGYKILHELGKQGTFYYPELDLLATAMALDLRKPFKFNFKDDKKRVLQMINSHKGELILNGRLRDITVDFNLGFTNLELAYNGLNVIDSDLYLKILNQPELLGNIHWRKFEYLLTDILETFGYEINLMQGTKDGGIDIIAFEKNNEFGQQKYLIQAKRWKGKVSVAPVRELLFLHNHHGASKSCLATTASFTKGAWSLADQYRWRLSLVDNNTLMKWVERAWKLRDI